MLQSSKMNDLSAAGALLWMTHKLLLEHGWTLQGSTIESFKGDMNLLPAQRFRLPQEGEHADIHVRGLRVGSKLFVHFVSSATSVRISLKISEFVKPRKTEAVEEEWDCIMDMHNWRCNLEILRWRLERNLFPEFSTGSTSVASAAELSRLPEPLLTRLAGFLAVPDFSRVAQTNKYLHQLQESGELWQEFLRRDYPLLQNEGEPKAFYISHWTRQKRMEAWTQYEQENRLRALMLRRQNHWRWRGGGRLPAPPLHLPPPPFLPLGVVPWSFRPPPHPDLLGDEDLDPFAFYFDPRFY
ncbi:hypothetical protein P3T76_013223 [Phytophthora citrophthora]|uniref:F-box domain-containing protein n=1 Tax=Phytophthora citrophthora TaxID=4793 RepID=A0AAD9G4S5_9STRA|nr:hypothetical protein P3T76_013223 [Phytophthora citrophthora]